MSILVKRLSDGNNRWV